MNNFKQTADFKLIKQLLITTEIAIFLVSLLPIWVVDGTMVASPMSVLFWNVVVPIIILLVGSFANLIFGIRLVRSALKRYYHTATPWEQSQLRLQFKFLRRLAA